MTGQITAILNSSLNINAALSTCAFCGEYVQPCSGICDETNIGWRCWHNDCYESHRSQLGMLPRFQKSMRPGQPPRESDNERRIRQHWFDEESDLMFEGMTESEFLGDVGDK